MSTTQQTSKKQLDTRVLQQLEKLLGQFSFDVPLDSSSFGLTQEELESDLQHGAPH
ncbi:MAG: hypothetical protein KUG77_14990 [Nannocystaceae bacterium]|nr:hypothetical protein [Nannocystaceae bacterium]